MFVFEDTLKAIKSERMNEKQREAAKERERERQGMSEGMKVKKFPFKLIHPMN